jgi:hypothetical protein
MNNVYQSKLQEYLNEIPNKMIILEVTKCCNYSTFILMYKEESLLDLYIRVSHHFGLDDLKRLSIGMPTCDNTIDIPVTSLKTIRKFINENTCCNPPNLVPVYDLPSPVTYRIYIDDCFEYTSKA